MMVLSTMARDAFEKYVERMGPFPPHSVSFVGTGPGDAGLLTVRGVCRIQQADVVVHVAGASPSWLALVRPDAQMVSAARTGGSKRIKPDEFLNLVSPHVNAGRRVVRLKSGDPFMFNRCEEECEALREAGIGVELVPGVTSGIAGPEYAGIGVTRPGIADAVTLVIGYEDPEGPSAGVDYARLIEGGTVVVYFGEKHLGGICRQMVAGGAPADLPVAVITNATRAEQSVETGTVSSFCDSPGVVKPSVIVIGEAVRTRATLQWRNNLPLADKTVLVTRPSELSGRLVGALTGAGAEVLESPMLQTRQITDDAVLSEAVANIDRYDWVVLTSVNGVDAMAEQLRAAGMDARALGGVKLAAIGPATARRLGRLFLTPDLVPDRYLSANLGRSLVERGVAGTRILFIRSSDANDKLPRILERAGARCDDLVGYRTQAASGLPDALAARLADGSVDWITFTSPSTFSNLKSLMDQRQMTWHKSVRLASIGPVTSSAIRDAGFEPTIEADEHTTDGLALAVIRCTTVPPGRNQSV